ncbi:iron complex outermembrane recepter protein [Sphingobium faniae]|nr:iron complex outermembrane recepter protein [Sphingobium faniae]
MKQSKKLTFGACAIVIAIPVSPLQAQSTGGQVANRGLEDIIVTAQRKEERLQEVPIAVNVLSGDRLVEAGLSGTTALQAVVPGLDFTATGVGGTPFLRGVGTTNAGPGNEPSVALYVDGVYMASPYSNMLDFNNIERVEVLKGPQGTLFGRNATGGVIQVITRDPKQSPEAEVSVGYGNYDTIQGSLYATTELGPNLAIDIAAQIDDQRDGFGRNVTLNVKSLWHKNYSVRSKLLWTPGDNTEIRLGADYAKLKSDLPAYRSPRDLPGVGGVLPPPGKYDTAINVNIDGEGQTRAVAEPFGASLRVDQDFGALRFVSISAYRENPAFNSIDSDGRAAFTVSGVFDTKQHNVSQEFQLLSPAESAIDWTVGAFLYRNVAITDGVIAGTALGRRNIVTRLRTKSGSIYGQATAEVLPSLKLTGGLRFTKENVHATGSLNGNVAAPVPDRAYSKLTWRLAANYAFHDDVHAYASYNRGIKSGGFDYLAPGSAGFAPEVVDAYEIGLKSQFLDRKARFNVSAFQNDFKNIQIIAIPQGTAITTNASSARIKGIDLDMQFAPMDGLLLSATAGYMKGEYLDFKNAQFFPSSPVLGPPSKFDASGYDTIRTPKYTASLNASYEFATSVGHFELSSTLTYNDGYAISVDNGFQQPSYTLLNTSVGWKSPRNVWGVRVWARNITDEYYYASANKGGSGESFVPAPPRTYGITLSARFN